MSQIEPLAAKVCQPCQGALAQLSPAEVVYYAAAVPQWHLVDDNRRLRRELIVKDFMTALDYFARLGALAEQEGHHPDLHLTRYRHVAIELWTHKAGGLTENDFIMAAKIDAALPPISGGTSERG
jgi:4a-hydroxytetrahydrobiopterin dehydratase